MEDEPTPPLESDGGLLESDGGGSLLPIIALILGLLALGAGGTALFLGYRALQALPALEAAVDEGAGRASEETAALNATLQSLQGDMEHLRNEIVTLKARQRSEASRQSEALEEVYRAINANRSRLNEHGKAIADIPDLIASLQPAPTPEPTTRNNTGSSERRSEEPSGEAEFDAAGNRLHTIRSGDTFGKLAREYGVSLTAILNANPTVNPNALQIGQKVAIPNP